MAVARASGVAGSEAPTTRVAWAWITRPDRFSMRTWPRWPRIAARPPALPDALGVGIGRRLVRGVAPPLPAEVDGGVPRVIVGRRRRGLALRAHPLVAGPGFQEGAVHREVLGREQARRFGLACHRREEGLRHAALQDPLPVFREHADVPHRVIHVRADKPAKQERLVELVHALPFAPDAVERLQREGPEELLRRDPGPAGVELQQRTSGQERL